MSQAGVSSEKILLDGEAIQRSLTRIAHEIVEANTDLERDSLEVRVALDDLVGNPPEAALDRLAVEEDLLGGNAGLAHSRALAQACTYIGLLSGLSGPS